MTEEICGNCKHLKRCGTVEKNICRLNLVHHNVNDECMWNTAKYPSKFEPATHTECEWCGVSDEIGGRHSFVRAKIAGRSRTICRDCYNLLRVVVKE